ncbi:MAG: acyl-CoA/acyl-ACP dehydrogenase [Deltaproteobacteria bacterium]|nr:acyl-CoA/acyl-ACP dehydrogenase [Deltaproteobacteria bacterium]
MGTAAPETDKGVFPRQAIGALGDAGFLGLISSKEVGGHGLGMDAASFVVQRIARECASTAMVVMMHYCATAVIEAHGTVEIRKAIAAGKHLSTLAFSEVGSRSQFWAPVSSATADGSFVKLDAKKSFVTSANHADSYVWSSKPLTGSELSTLWLVPRGTAGMQLAAAGFDGIGLRGNDSIPVVAEGARIPATAMLGVDGAGFGIMMGAVLPWFNVLSASVSCGLMEAATAKTAAHAGGTKFTHAGSAIAELPTVRAFIARMQIQTDMCKALLGDTLAAIAAGRPDATLRVLESKAATGESSAIVTDLAMRVCGGAAFRKEVGVERIFRDSRAALVMGPTTDVLYDFIGKAVCGLPLF